MPVPAPSRRESRVERLEIRATPRQTAAIRQAAEALHKTVSAFVLDAAFLEAQRALADRRLFSLDACRWELFVRALDRPPKEKPRLRTLIEQPGVLD